MPSKRVVQRDLRGNVVVGTSARRARAMLGIRPDEVKPSEVHKTIHTE